MSPSVPRGANDDFQHPRALHPEPPRQLHPRFSVITICYNDRTNLAATAKSVLGQIDASFEWVIVDGASTDGTIDDLQTYGRDNRVQWSSSPDEGIYDAFNKGVASASGDYLVFICAGDEFCGPETLGKVSAYIDAKPHSDLYYGDAIEVERGKGTFLRKARDHSTIWWNLFTHHQSMFYARECFQRVSYDKGYRIGGDYALTLELLRKGASATRLPFATSRFLLGGTSQKNYWLGERENWIARRRLEVSQFQCAGIYAAHAAIRIGRTRTPWLYRLLRYAPAKTGGDESGNTASDGTAVGGGGFTPSTRAATGVDAGRRNTPFFVSGVEINAFSLIDALDKIMARQASGSAFTVCTMNMDHVVKLGRDAEFRAAYAKASVVLADGFPIVWAGRLCGRSLRRACGSDLLMPLCARAEADGKSIFLLGPNTHVLEVCVDLLLAAHPNLRIGGFHAPSPDFDPKGDEAKNIIALLKAAQPDFCFVGLGAPKQEIFTNRCLDHVRGTGFLNIGAGLDFIAGTQRRAPAVLQKSGLEWLWRLLGNPARLWRRYAVSLITIPVMLLQTVKANRRHRGSTAALSTSCATDV
jgi:exopolysaccharide biosynthesis WecB/TagA/CpsF family protein